MSELWSAENSSSVCEFYEKTLSTIWSIKVNGGDGTGFCVKEQGLIMTCNHVVTKDKDKEEDDDDDDDDIISCVNLKTNIEFTAKIVKNIPSWDMALLKLDVGSNQRFDYVKMGNEMIDEVFCGQDVLAIGNPDKNIGSLMMAKVTYPFDDYDISTLLDSTEREYVLPQGFLPHRTVGTMWPESGYNPNLPLIQTTRLGSTGGASGSPIFNQKGSVLGMIAGSGEFQIGMHIHFQAINHFINHKVDDDDGEAGGSRSEKQQHKQKGKRGRY